MATNEYVVALIKAMNNERERMNRKGTKNIVIVNRRKGFLEGLEHAMTLYILLTEGN